MVGVEVAVVVLRGEVVMVEMEDLEVGDSLQISFPRSRSPLRRNAREEGVVRMMVVMVCRRYRTFRMSIFDI